MVQIGIPVVYIASFLCVTVHGMTAGLSHCIAMLHLCFTRLANSSESELN